MKPCHQCPPSRCPQHTHAVSPCWCSAPRCRLRTLQQVPRRDPWSLGRPPGVPCIPQEHRPFLATLAWLPLLSVPSVHTRTRLVPQKVFSVARLCWCLCGCHSTEPPQPCCPTQSPVGRAVGRLQLSLGPCGGLGALGQKRCGVSIAMFLLRLSWRLVAVEGACPRCTNTG